MPDNSTWIAACTTEVRKYINNTYTMDPNPTNPPEFELEVVWAIPGESVNRMLVRTDIGDDIRYLVSYMVTAEGDESINIEPIVDGPMQSKKSF
jgi:hypothetical protein